MPDFLIRRQDCLLSCIFFSIGMVAHPTMIQDTLENAARYEALSPRFAKAFRFLRCIDGNEAPGRHEIDGDKVFGLIQSYTTKPHETALMEAHRKYIDIQFVHKGRETILWAPLAAMKDEALPYNKKTEAALWRLVPDVTELHMSAGHIAILFPCDAHAPGVEWEEPEEVFKVVIKVAIA